MPDEVVTGSVETPVVAPAGNPETPQPETPPAAETSVEKPPEALPQVPGWVASIDTPQPPPVQQPPQYPQFPPAWQPPVSQWAGPQQPRALKFEDIVDNPQVVEQRAAEIARAQMIPVAQAIQQIQYGLHQQAVQQAVSTAKSSLSEFARRDASLSNPQIGPQVKQMYDTLFWRAQQGDPQAIQSLSFPRLADHLVMEIRANLGIAAGNPVSYQGGTVETGQRAATAPPKKTLSEEAARQAAEWGITPEQWLANEELAEKERSGQ